MEFKYLFHRLALGRTKVICALMVVCAHNVTFYYVYYINFITSLICFQDSYTYLNYPTLYPLATLTSPLTLSNPQSGESFVWLRAIGCWRYGCRGTKLDQCTEAKHLQHSIQRKSLVCCCNILPTGSGDLLLQLPPPYRYTLSQPPCT